MFLGSCFINSHKTEPVSYIEIKGVRKMTGKEQVLQIFPKDIRARLKGLPVEFEKLQEVRLRAGRPLMILWDNREYGVTEEGRLTEGGQELFCVTPQQIRETVEFMSSFSLYAAEEELRQGFLTIQGGHRIGVAGRIVTQGKEVRLLKFISFLNVRIAHERKGCADGLMDLLYSPDRHFLNTLIISPPRCGKTTLLRDIIRQVSNGRPGKDSLPGLNVGVVDERSELAACYQGVPQNDLGLRTDVLDCCPKSQGMMMLVRTMAPDVIAVDEVGGREDTEAIEYAGNCGCALAATVHGGSLEEILCKPGIGRLVKEGFFKRIILLDQRQAGRIQQIYGERLKPLGKPKGGAATDGGSRYDM